jgi:Rrf2 family nitric oxide-sensitive transcriptional repressor
MRLTTFSDYTLRVLIYLGLPRERRATIAEIALAYGISENHLTKVVHHLAQSGMVQTVRGKGGGLSLARTPDAINLGTVLQATEGDQNLLDCMNCQSDCCIQPCCRLIPILRQAQSAMFGILSSYTLADLLREEQHLSQILITPRIQAR